MLSDALHLVESGQDLSLALMAETLGRIMDGQCSEDEIARLLVALHRKRRNRRRDCRGGRGHAAAT